MNDHSKHWLKGSFPQWLVTGLLALSIWFAVRFVNDRESKLEFLMKEQTIASKAIAQLDFKVSLLEGNARRQAETAKQISESFVVTARSLDKLTIIVEELRRKP